MEREFLLLYLGSVDCSDGGINATHGQLYRNDLNGLETYIPDECVLKLRTYCRIFYELKVDPPKENGYDSDYAIYISFMDK